MLVGRGSWFRAEHDKVPTEMFFRATYAAASPENMTEAIRRFGEAIEESFGVRDTPWYVPDIGLSLLAIPAAVAGVFD